MGLLVRVSAAGLQEIVLDLPSGQDGGPLQRGTADVLRVRACQRAKEQEEQAGVFIEIKREAQAVSAAAAALC